MSRDHGSRGSVCFVPAPGSLGSEGALCSWCSECATPAVLLGCPEASAQPLSPPLFLVMSLEILDLSFLQVYLALASYPCACFLGVIALTLVSLSK